MRSIFSNGKVSDAIEVERCQMLDNEAVNVTEILLLTGEMSHQRLLYVSSLQHRIFKLFSKSTVRVLVRSSEEK